MQAFAHKIVTFLGVVSILFGIVGAALELSGSVLPWIASSAAQGPPASLPVTAPDLQWASFASQNLAPDPMFAADYSAHGGAAVLGPALTPVMPISGGWLQFYRAGALYVPGRSPAYSRNFERAAALDDGSGADDVMHLLLQGYSDRSSGATELPVLQELLAVGSELGIGDPSSNLTYVDLRRATQPSQQIAAPGWYTADHATGPTGTFVPEGQENGAIIGHLIPAAIWHALNQSSIAPDGWRTDFGAPLTEALTGSALPGGHVQPITVQVYEHGALVLKGPIASGDQSAVPAPQPLSIGLDFLETFGPPTVAVTPGTHLWGAGAAALFQSPDPTGPPLAHIGLRFPLTASNDVGIWAGGQLWYPVVWQSASTNGAGWVAADSVTFADPGNGPVWAGVDMLDAGLGAYVAGLGPHVGALIYDVTRQQYYYDNDQSSFIVASSVKVPIMLTLLTQIEQQGRQPTSDEMYLLTTMIENSDNSSAQALFEEVGGAPGLTAYMQQIGVPGLDANADAWGWSTITPRAMVQLLTLLLTGQVLTPQDRAVALNLMENVESDQQVGVGSTAPTGATVAVKDGWVTGPDNLWVMNSSGIVSLGQETYIISVYTTSLDDLPEGWDITEHICGAVAQLLN
jgi:hypothetical protein